MIIASLLAFNIVIIQGQLYNWDAPYLLTFAPSFTFVLCPLPHLCPLPITSPFSFAHYLTFVLCPLPHRCPLPITSPLSFAHTLTLTSVPPPCLNICPVFFTLLCTLTKCVYLRDTASTYTHSHTHYERFVLAHT